MIFEDKQSLRHKIIEDQRTLSDQITNDILSKVIHLIKSLAKSSIGLYYPMESEPDLLKIAAISEDKISLPKISGKDMVFVRYCVGSPLEQYGFKKNLYQPVSNAKALPEVIIVPGLAFSIGGYRLGFGLGYYDRYLNEARNLDKIIAVGVCSHERLCEYLPYHSYDAKMDYIITDKTVIKI